jgi:hypothetical protein
MTRAKQSGYSGERPGIVEAVGVNLALTTFVGPDNHAVTWGGAPCLGGFPLAMINVSGLSIASVTTPLHLRVGVHVDAEQVADPWSLLRAFDLALTDLEAEVAS